MIGKIGLGWKGLRVIGKIARSIREARLKRDAYREGYADAKAGIPSRY